VVAVFLLLATIALGFLALFSLPPEHGRLLWRGFRTILVDVSVPESDVMTALSAAGATNILSESTDPILVSDWAGLETMSLGDAKSFLVPGDPRLDSYLKRANLWFEARAGSVAYRVYYVQDARPFGSANPLDRAVERGLKGFSGRYIMPDAANSPALMGVNTLYFTFGALFVITVGAFGPLLGKSGFYTYGLHSRKLNAGKFDRVAFRLSLALPWAVLAAGGLTPAALAALWGLALIEAADKLDMPLDEFRQNNGLKAVLLCLRLQGSPAMALPAVALIASLATPSFLPAIGLTLLGSLVAIQGYALISTGHPARHRFIPLRIGGRPSVSRRPILAAEKTRAVLACSMIVAWGLCRILPSPLSDLSPSDLALPRPENLRGSARPLIAESRQRVFSESGDVLPGLASYLVHRAIQEALPYCRIGEGRPDPFAPVRFPAPSREKSVDTIPIAGFQGIDFSDEWARAAYASVPSLSVEGMLLHQSSAMLVRMGADVERSGRPLAPIEYLLYIFLLVPPIGRLFFSVPYARNATSGELRQEA
jgi:hypothetical protein